MSLWIDTKLEVSMAHRQFGVPDDDKCKNLHGHNLLIHVQLNGEPLQYGYIVDFKLIKELIKEKYDHTTVLNCNDNLIAPLISLNQPVYTLPDNPTCENISEDIAKLIRDNCNENNNIHEIIVTVRETELSDSKSTYHLKLF